MKLRVKQGGPPSKAKYSWTTDSEQVRRLKGEKNRYKRSQKNLKPCIYKQSKTYAGLRSGLVDGVPFA